ncbi:MAG: ABC transporter permease [Vicinamibacterales bacterium]
MASFSQDVLYAVRTLRSMRGAAALAILTLALGIGSTTTMFSVVYAALLRPVPFPEPGRIVMLYLTRATAAGRDDRVRFSNREIRALMTQAASFEAVSTMTRTSLSVEAPDPQQIDGEVVSAAYFDLLRVGAMTGRLFSPDEDTDPGAHPVLLVSARLWRTHLGADPNAVGRTLAVNGVPLTVIGIMPDGFAGLSGRADVWLPTAMAPTLTYAEYLTTPQHFIGAVARLEPGVSGAAATAEMAVIGPRVAAMDATGSDASATWGGRVLPIDDARIDPAGRRSALLLLAAIVCVLLIACANVASLLMARMRHRRREIAVRSALGAGTWRVVRQLVTESAVLALAGGALGTIVAVWGVRFVVLAAPSALPSTQTGYQQLSGFAVPSIDAVVLAFALLATLLTSVLFGVAPALAASRTNLLTALREDQRTTATGRSRVLGGIVVVEVAVAVLLVAGASLFVASFVGLQKLRAGFEPAGVLTFRIAPPASRYAPEAGPVTIERFLTRIQQTPGVTMAAINRCTPLNNACARTTIYFPGEPGSVAPPVVERHYVSADYFRVLGIPVKSGRAIDENDRLGRPPVTVINERAAARFWPGENPLGKHVWFGSATGFTDPAHPVEIVGVVGDVKYGTVDDPPSWDFYTSYKQFAYPDTMVMVKADHAGDAALVQAMREAVASVDHTLPIHDVMTLDERADDALTRPRFHATMLGMFAGAALLLAAMGVYGVMSYAVSARTQEIGIRVALGADVRRVMTLVLGESVRLAAIGGVVGIAAALGLGRLVRNLVFDVAPADPAVLIFAVAVLLAAALLAAFLPARRASAVDPIVVLRSE